MKIIIPMSGLGERFIKAGYEEPKPLIQVQGKPIIEHVLNLFPGEQDFIFICREEHLATTHMKEVLTRLMPTGKIVSIPSHKYGPVYAVAQVFALIEDDEPIITNYCDFFMDWDYHHFKKTVLETGCDGAIPCYTGFHPHLLHAHNFYAGCKTDDQKYLVEIQEKFSFTSDKSESHHSVGTYYFSKGAYVKKYFAQLMQEKTMLNGEYYISLVYALLLRDKKKVLVYDDIPHFCQWGTPEDLEEYNYWSAIFHSKQHQQSNENPVMNILIPMAGAGSRFQKEGYTIPKPLIPVQDVPMVVKATEALPPGKNHMFICRDFHVKEYKIDTTLKRYFSNAVILTVNNLSEGQASTCLLAESYINNEEELCIGASDNGMIYDSVEFEESKKNADCLIFTFRNNVAVVSKPEQYGWVAVGDKNTVTKVSVKMPISNQPIKDHAVVGAFWFKKGRYFVEAANRMMEENRRINNEFYVDECINDLIAMGKKVKVFEINYYLGWGTPNELKSFEYWEKFFKQNQF